METLKIEKWRKTFDENGEIGAISTDFLQAFVCIEHNLLTTKLNKYEIDSNR